MKYLQKTSILGLVLLVLLTNCGGDDGDERSINDIQLEKLVATWNISNVTLDNVNRTTDYPNFKLTISGTPGATSFGYNTTGRGVNNPWPSSGNWRFGSNVETQIERIDDSGNPNDPNDDDIVDITYAVTDTQLTLNFTFTGTGFPARTSNVNGDWVFTFTK